MRINTALPTTAIKSAFLTVISEQRGAVTDIFDDGQRVYIRSTLPMAWADVRPGDRFRGGVALRAKQGEILIYPYLLRHVCTNGMIFAEAIVTLGDWDLRSSSRKDAIRRLRTVVTVCSEKKVFAEVIAYPRDTVNAKTLGIPHLLADLDALELRYGRKVVQSFMDHLLGDRDWSPYGVMNAVTSLARDIEDPDLRWDLEVLGGAIAAGKIGAAGIEWSVAATG